MNMIFVFLGIALVFCLVVHYARDFLKSDLTSQIIISRHQTHRMMEENGFDPKSHLTFEFSLKKDEPSDNKIRKVALQRLVSIFQRSAKEIIATYFVVVTIESSKIHSPNREFHFIEAIVWIKKKPNSKVEIVHPGEAFSITPMSEAY